MSLQHYLPATFLAQFSGDTKLPRRERRLIAVDKLKRKIFEGPASKLGAENEFYTLVNSGVENPHSIDNALSGYEAQLHLAINLLIDGKITADLWAKVLVNFVTCLLVRGPDFNRRFESRIFSWVGDHFKKYTDRDNTNFARLMERQRIWPSIFSAKWTVSRVESKIPLIINDLGYTPFYNPAERKMGLVIPLNKSSILTITPRNKSVIAIGKNGIWIPQIYYVPTPVSNHEHLNEVLFAYGNRFAFGSNRDELEKIAKKVNVSLPIMEPYQIGFLSGKKAMEHELTYFNLLAALANPPRQDGDAIYIDFEKNEKN